MKRTVASLLIAVMMLTAFVACSDPKDENTPADTNGPAGSGTVDSDTEKAEEVLEIPNEKFSDEEFVILVNKNYNWNFSQADFDEPSDNALENALYLRNREVEDMLGCTISERLADTYDSIAGDFQLAVESADTEAFDVAFMNLLHCGTQVGAGNCYDLAEFQYIDLDKSWWDQSSVEQLAIGGRNYMVGGEVLYSDKELLWLIFFTKELISANGLEDPYKLVENNEWTWDKMNEMMAVAAYDENANGTWDEGDIWGLCTHDYHYAAMWVTAEQRLVRLDENGTPYATWGTDQFVTVYDDILEMLTQDCVKDDSDVFIISAMKNGKTLFAGEVVGWVSGYRENEKDFGLLPMPKYSKDQDEYYTLACQQADLLVVGNNQDDTYFTGIVLEAMAAKGQEILLPTYYDNQLQSRHSRDEESAAMLDIIFKNRVYDIGTMFNWGNISTQLMFDTGNPAALWASNRKAFNKAMEKSLEKILGD